MIITPTSLYAGPNQVPDALQNELRIFLNQLADTKRALGLRYAEWCDRAPTLEAGVAASGMAQDQLGQARVLYAMIGEFPDAPANLDDETRQHSLAMAYLDHPFRSWSVFVVANLLIGSSVTLTEEALANSAFAPLRSRIPKMLLEERFHHIHAEGWFKYLAQVASPLPLEQARAAAEILPHALCWFGDARQIDLLEGGVIRAAPGQLRERLLDRLGPMLRDTLMNELVIQNPGGHWSYSNALPWGHFNPLTRRLRVEV